MVLHASLANNRIVSVILKEYAKFALTASILSTVDVFLHQIGLQTQLEYICSALKAAFIAISLTFAIPA